jgi:dipeptidyl aminopeptidase/acylaminoacyl peptidase
MSNRGTKAWKLGCGIAAVLGVLLLCFVWLLGLELCRRFHIIPQASRRITQSAREALGPGTLPVSCPTSDGLYAPGWYRTGETRAAIVFLHGLGGTRQQLARIARRLHEEGWGVLLIDQRGHGEHPSDLTTFGRAEALDALAAVEWLRKQPEVDPGRIGLYGASMGAATSIRAAAQDPRIGCVVADSSYAAFRRHLVFELAREEARIHLSPRWRPLVMRAFLHYSPRLIGEWSREPEPVDIVGDISCPLFLIQGENDKRINPDDLNELARAARDGGTDVAVWQVRGAGHCGYHDSEEFFRRLTGFFRMYL